MKTFSPTKSTLSSPKQPSHVSAEAWSTRIAERYHVRLTAELVDWFDNGLWQLEGFGEYREPIPPADLIEKFPEAIWPGLMPPDFLPVLGNMAGDWLCMRLGPHGKIAEIVQWYHGGGDWLPWGNSLAEAIAFDAASQRLPGPSRRHAIPAEPTRGADAAGDDPLLNWAIHQFPAAIASQVRRVIGGDLQGEELAKELIRSNVAEIAVQSEWVQRLLADPELLKLDSDRDAPERWGVSRNVFNQWLFDIERAPESVRSSLLGTAANKQHWRAAAEHCRRVVEIAPHLAWGWDILGYEAERSGRYAEAAKFFASGLSRSVFTDQSIRLRTHWTAPLAGKFSAARLRAMIEAGQVTKSELTAQIDDSYLDALCAGEDERQELVTEYWLGRSDRSSLAGNFSAAFDEAYAAGWDLGAATLPAYGSVLDRLVELAKDMGDEARAELARTHRHCLRDRLGI